MKSATYSLLTLRPDPERIDNLCVGVVVRTVDDWKVLTLPSAEKLRAIDSTYSFDRLAALGASVARLVAGCADLLEARSLLRVNNSSLALHEFEGRFAFHSDAEFSSQLQAVMHESVVPTPTVVAAMAGARRRVRIRTKLRKQFQSMGILGATTDDIDAHKVVRNFPVSARHGLVAEFALKNSAMHFTETIDFEVGGGAREKAFEAQAKCLVMRAATEAFGAQTQCHFVVAGALDDKSARSVDLLSTAGNLYSLDNSADMSQYFDAMARAAGTTGQLPH